MWPTLGSRTAKDQIRSADLSNCNLTENISSLFEIRFPLNLAYLSEYFSPDELYNLTAETLLNETIEIRLPKLALEDEQLNTYFGVEKQAHFDLATMINRTKQDAETYSSLAHYLFNEILQANAKQSAFDILNPFSWLTIFGWITSVFALILAIFLRVKMHSLSLLLLARPVRAMPTRAFPKVLQLTVPTTTGNPVTIDTFKEWAKHVQHVPNLMPIELLILLCLFLLILFALVRMLYRRRRQAIARTTLNLEIGDSCQSMVLPIIDLIHPPNCYRFVINKAEINLHLVETNLFANLYWNNGVSLLNMPLEYAVQLPTNIKVGLRKIKLLKSLLLKPHYVTIHVINGTTSEICELVVLRTYAMESAEETNLSTSLYPSL